MSVAAPGRDGPTARTGWRLGVPDADGAATPQARRTARWVATLFAAELLLPRLAIPGIPIALLLPVLLGWVALALRRGVVRLEPTRVLLFGVVVAVTGAAIVAQDALVPAPLISLPAWALVIASTSPFVVTLVDRSPGTFSLALGHIVRLGLGLAALCLVMTGSQVAGLAYRDWLAEVLPSSLLLPGFNVTYPYSYGSSLYRANAWIGLEPSFVSFQLGIALVAALLMRRSLTVTLVLSAGMLATASGSGILLAAVALVLLLSRPRRRVLLRYVVPAVAASLAAALTPLGQALLARVGEVGQSGSSASLRAVQPYSYLAPVWTGHPATALLGDGPGSAEALIERSGIDGLLVPTPLKIFFEYGLLAGTVLTVFLVVCFLGATSRALAAGVFVSLWTIQPGLTTTVLVTSVVAVVSLWSPQPGVRIEDVVPRDSVLGHKPPGRARA